MSGRTDLAKRIRERLRHLERRAAACAERSQDERVGVHERALARAEATAYTDCHSWLVTDLEMCGLDPVADDEPTR